MLTEVVFCKRNCGQVWEYCLRLPETYVVATLAHMIDKGWDRVRFLLSYLLLNS